MAALQLKDGARFDPKDFFDYCETQVTGGGMDRKWFPDFIRLVDDFEWTNTQKVLVRNLKKVHFCRRRMPDTPIFWRTRSDSAYRPFTVADYEAVRREFEASERVELLDR